MEGSKKVYRGAGERTHVEDVPVLGDEEEEVVELLDAVLHEVLLHVALLSPP